MTSKEMFSFQSYSSVPVKGGRVLAGQGWENGVGGLVEVDGRIVWGGEDAAYISDENCDQWERLADSSETKATLAVCRGCLVYVGGLTNGGLCSNKVMVWSEGKWTLMTEMLEGCWRCSVVTCSVGEGSLVVMGGIIPEGRSNSVQMFDGKTNTWHKGPPLPLPCWAMSAVVHEDQVFVMGGHGMDRAVWWTNISDLSTAHPYDKQLSVWRKLPDVPYYYSSACVVDGVLLAIGGTQDLEGEEKSSAIYAYDHEDQKWHHVGDMPFKCCFGDTLLQSGQRLLMVDGDSQKMLKITVDTGLAMLFVMPSPNETDESKEMFSYQIYSSVPVQGGRFLVGQGWEEGVGVLAEMDGRIVWGGDNGTYVFDKNCNKWERLADSSECKATLALCGGCLVCIGGMTDFGLCSDKMMVWREGKWSFMAEMLEGCWRSSVVTCGDGGCDLVVMGGIVPKGRSDVVQVFGGKTMTWHKGPPLPLPCWAMSAVVHEDQVFVMGGRGMDRAVWWANITDLLFSVWRKLPDVPYYYSSACVVDGVLLAIGGTQDTKGEKKTSSVCAYHHADQKWQHVGKMPLKGSFLNSLLLSGGEFIVVDGDSRQVLKIIVKDTLRFFAPSRPNESGELNAEIH